MIAYVIVMGKLDGMLIKIRSALCYPRDPLLEFYFILYDHNNSNKMKKEKNKICNKYNGIRKLFNQHMYTYVY